MLNKCLCFLFILGLFNTFCDEAKAVTGSSYTITQDTPYVDPDISTEELIDPFESFNRVIFEINLGLDVAFIRPLAQLYITVFPPPMRRSFSNVLQNAASPLTFIHDVLQLNPERASNTFFRFLINTTLGVVGIFDVATDIGISYHKEDMGQTMAAYGVEGGPYLMLPILGPSNFRDTIGRVTDAFINPLRIVLFQNDLESVYYGQLAVGTIDERAGVVDLTDRINKRPDPYKQYRSLYLQNRAYRIKGREIDTSNLPGAGIE